MAQPAVRAMTVTEFLEWHPGDDRRYELVDGSPLLMAPPATEHARIAVTLGGLLWPALRGTGCAAFAEVGVRVPLRDDCFYVVDLVVSCGPVEERWIPEPRILIEILSPSTENHDRKTKLPDYRSIPSAEEIVLIDSRQLYCEVHRRVERAWQVEIYRSPDDVIELMRGRVALKLADLYEGVNLEPTA